MFKTVESERAAFSRARLMAGSAFGFGLAMLVPQQAMAQCAVTATSVTCGTTTTENSTYAGTTPAINRNYNVDTSTAAFTGTVNTGATVDGFGLAFTNTVGGTNALNVVNNGTVQINAANTATEGGSAALNINATGATPVNYSGTGDIINLGAAGEGLRIYSDGTGAITANVGGSVTSAAGQDAIEVFKDIGATAGDINLTTASGEVVQTGFAGVGAQAFDLGYTGDITVTNNAAVGSLTGTPNSFFYGVLATSAGSTGDVVLNNTGTIGSATDRAQAFGLFASADTAASDVSVTITNGPGAIFADSGILAQSYSTGAINVTTGTGAINAVTNGILVTSGAILVNPVGTNVITVTTGSGAITASDAAGVGINVVGGIGATTITTGGTVTGGNFGVQAATLGTQNFAVNGVTTGTAGAGIHSDTTANRAIVIGAAGNVTGGTEAILLANTGTASVTNGGRIGAAATDLAINAAAAGATTVTNQTAGTINGRLTFGAGDDTFNNAGTLNTQGTTDFGAGTDSFTNAASGTISLSGATTLEGLETLTNAGRINLNSFTLTGPAIAFNNTGTIDTSGNAGLAGFTSFSNAGTLDLAAGTFTVPAAVFTNTGTIVADEGATTITGQTSFANSGTLNLQDGAADDVLTINSAFVGSGASALSVDVGDTAADRLVIAGAASGSTTVNANYLGTGLINQAGVLVVDTTTSTPGAFSLGAVTGNTSPLINYSLAQVGADYFLVAAPNAGVFQPLAIGRLGQTFWYQSADEVIAQTRLPAETVGISFWGQVYGSKDETEISEVQEIGTSSFFIDEETDTKRVGIQAGVDYGFEGARVGLTGGYARAKADSTGDLDLKARGWNVGVYGQFGGPLGFHGELLAKHDRFDIDFTRGVFDGEGTDARANGIDGSLGYRFGIGGDATFDANIGVSRVKTKFDDIDAFGFNYDLDSVKSTRGRLGGRLTFGSDVFGGGISPYIDGTLYREFDGDSRIALFDGANTYDLESRGKGTYFRAEAGIVGRPAGPMLAAWADFGDRKGLGIRAGFRFGAGRVVEAAAPPPPPPAPVVSAPAPATQTCSDGSVVLATDTCPVPPPPPPPPAPAPERG